MYNKDQPRVPKGNPNGGQWTSADQLAAAIKKYSSPSEYQRALEKNVPNNVKYIKKITFSEENAIKVISECEKLCDGLDYEMCYIVATDGSVWKVKGTSGNVVPASVPQSLKGSYTYHNHPGAVTNFSFSSDDLIDFLENEEEYCKASDHEYEYVMRRTADTPSKQDIDLSSIHAEWKKVTYQEVYPLAFDENIDMDSDEYHEVMLRMAKKYGLNYVRRKKEN